MHFAPCSTGGQPDVQPAMRIPSGTADQEGTRQDEEGAGGELDYVELP